MLIILGSSTYTFRNSSLFNNLSIFGVNKSMFYISQFLTLFVIGTMLTISFNLIIFILGKAGILLNSLSISSKYGTNIRVSVGTNVFQYSSLVILIYLSNLNIILTFSIYFLVHKFSKNIKNYYFVIIGLLILSFCFGAFLNSFFDDSYGSHGEGIFYEPNIFPNWMFIPSLFYPFFGVNQMFAYGVSMVGTNKWHIGENIGAFGKHFFEVNFVDYWQWAMVFIQPYILIVFSTLMWIFISTVKKDNLLS